MRNPNAYEYGYDPRMADINLNFQSSSKLVSLQNQEFYPPNPQSFQGMPPNTQYPPVNMYPPQYMGYDGNPGIVPMQQNLADTQGNESEEVQMLRSQVTELDQALNREVEANKVSL